MEERKLDPKHIKLQFLMMFLSLLGFLLVAMYVGNIVWVADFRNFVMLFSSMISIFISTIALLRYYTNRKELRFFFLGLGFLGVGVLDVVQILFNIDGFASLLSDPEATYTVSGILSKGFLSILIFLSWLLSEKTKKGSKFLKKEKGVLIVLGSIFVFFTTLLITLSLNSLIQESVLVVVVGMLSLFLLTVSLFGYLLRRGWENENLDFWIIFCIAFLFLSQIFYLPFLNIEFYNMLNLSVWAQFLGYVVLLAGFLNSIYDLYVHEVEVQSDLVVKNRLLNDAKSKIEEAYLFTRKEKMALLKKKGGK